MVVMHAWFLTFSNSIQIYTISNPNSIPTVASNPDCSRDPLCSNDVCNTDLPIESRAAALVNALTLEEKILNSGSVAPGSQRIGLPPYSWDAEALHGVAQSTGVQFATPFGANYSYATSFPMPLGMASAFDDDLISAVAGVIGKEARAFYNGGFSSLTFMTPDLNPYKDPRWGRGMETPGEDVYHIQRYLRSLVPSLQGGLNASTAQMAATCKHFAAYDIETGRNGNNLAPTAQEFAEYYAWPFAACTRDSGAIGTMCSYNAVDGIPSCANTYQLQNVLKETLGFDNPYNYIIGDCGAVENIYDEHHFASGFPEAAAIALNAGVDIDCGQTYQDYLNVSIPQNMTTEAAINQALTRAYAALIKTGYFDAPSDIASISWADVNTPAAQQLAYQSAVDGFVLLKNDGLLPIRQSNPKVALIGPLANATQQMQGIYFGTPPYLISALAAFQNKSTVQYAFGTQVNTSDTSNFTAAITAAQNSDYVVYVGGIDTTVESEGHDRTAISWPGNQLDLIAQLANVGKPLVVIQMGAGQLDDSALLSNDAVSAILWTGYPGQSGGSAIFDVVTGAQTVAGRLPVTQYPENYTSAVSLYNMNLRPSSGFPGRTYKWYSGTPVLPFGFGLHYTNFTASWTSTPSATYHINQILSAAPAPKDLYEFLTVSVDVKNVGGAANVASDYVGLLFASSTDAGPAPHPDKQLVSYGRLKDIAVNMTGTLAFNVSVGSLLQGDQDGNLYLYPGTYKLALDYDGQITTTFRLTGSATLVQAFPPRPSTETAYEDLGCYVSGTVLSGQSSTSSRSNTPQSCITSCHHAGHLYAGVQTK
jgi:beta-D-xylosidase 4